MNVEKLTFLGIDHGTKHVGVAIARKGLKIAYPLMTIGAAENVVSNIKKLINEHEVDQIIVGLPRNLNANETTQTAIVKDFIAHLKSEITQTVRTQDETSSTERALAKGATKSNKDQWAAAIILQDYIDERHT